MIVSEFPDVVDFYEGWLSGALAAHGYPHALVESGAFNARSGEQVWLQRDGGRVLDVARDQPRLRVNVLSDLDIGPFTQRVRTLIRSSAGAGPVRRVTELSGPIEIPNNKPWRYMLFELVVVGSPLTLT